MRIAVVTGASSGLGREFAKQIRDRFVTIDEIWIMARRLERLAELKQELRSVHVRMLPYDVTNEEDMASYAQMLRYYHPQIRVLVNAAGFGKMGYVSQIDTEDQTGMVCVNCESLTKITKLSLPYMAKKANIINIASSAAFLPQPNFAVYAASKAYVLSFSRALNQELKKRNICVTAVCPGPVDTEFFDIAETYTKTKGYKTILRVKAKDVCALALEDAAKGRAVSTYGPVMKAFRVAAKLVPHGLILPFFASDRTFM